jgi:tetratricopeptide (TPR) repeat protein
MTTYFFSANRGPVVLTVLILLSMATVLQASELPPVVQKTLYEAGQAMENGSHAKATQILRQFRQAHADTPHHLVEFTLGNALSMQNKPKDALLHYQRCTELEPDYAPGWQNLGKTALDLGDHPLAGRALTRTYELGGKKDHDLLFHACAAHILGGEAKKALSGLEHLTSGKAGQPKTPWLEALLKVYLDLGQEKKAARTLDGMLANDGNNAALWKLLAQIQARQNEYRKSLAAWEIYTSMHQPTPEELVLMGDLYAAIGVPAKAAESYEHALVRKDCPKLREKMVNAHLAARNPAKVVESAKTAINKRPSGALWQAMGRALFELGEYDQAADAFAHSAQLNPGDGHPHLMRGYCALRIKNRDMALTALEQARHFPNTRDQAAALLKVAATL